MASGGPHASRPGRRLALVGVGLLSLLTVVAVASRGHAPGGGGGASKHVRPAILFEYFVLMLFVGFAVAAAIMFHTFWETRHERASAPRRSFPLRVLLSLSFLVVAVLASFFLYRHYHRTTAQPGGAAGAPAGKGRLHRGSSPSAQPAPFDWAPVVVVLSISGAGALAGGTLWLRSRRREGSDLESLAAELSSLLDETLDDLHGESDPRRAVIAAYARMERILASYGVPRRVFEAPHEYLARVLEELHASAASVTALTALFERAKFSGHAIGSDLKEEAIAALAAVRDELRSYT